MVEETSRTSLFNSCPSCGQLIDVASFEPFTKIPCPHCGNPLRVRCDFDQFLLRKKIGEGGMSRVYLADDTRLQRKVALKILNPRYGKDQSRVAQFENEARLMAQINHPNVVRVYTVGYAQSYFYIAMELVGGGSLEERILQLGKLPESEVLHIGNAVSHGLLAAKTAGLVHRDIKPGNILFSEDNEPKIVDFGLALMTQEKDESGEIWATPFYVPPEKLLDQPDDFRGDMYSLGATLYHAAVGKPPHPATTASIEALRVMKSEPVDIADDLPQISQGTRLVINRMLAVSPDDRFHTYEDNINAFNDSVALLRAGGKFPLIRRRSFRIGVAAGAAILTAILSIVLSKPEAVQDDGKFIPANNESLLEESQLRFVEARKTLTSGLIQEAEECFSNLATGHRLPQPARNWARINLSLARLFLGNLEGTTTTLTELQKDAHYSNDSAQQINVSFFYRLTEDMLAQKPLPVLGINRYRSDSMEAIGLILNGMRHFNEGNLSDAKAILTQFLKATPPETVAWIQDYKTTVAHAISDITFLESTLTIKIDHNSSLLVAEESLKACEAAPTALHYPALARKILKSHVDEQRTIVEGIKRREERLRFVAGQKLKTNEFEIFNTLTASAQIHAFLAQYSSAASAFASTNFTSPELRQAAADMHFLWAGAAEFRSLLLRDLVTISFKGRIPLKSKPPIFGQIVKITRTNWLIRTFSNPDATTSNGEVTIPVGEIPFQTWSLVARHIASTIANSKEYYRRLTALVCYAKVTDNSREAADMEQTLLNELHDFRLRWTRIQEYDTLDL